VKIVLLDEAQERFEVEDRWWRENRNAQDLVVARAARVMARPVIDVAVFTNAGVISATVDVWQASPPLSVEVDVGQGVTVAPIDENIADYVFDLCSPHRLKQQPVQQFKSLYAFMRDDDADETSLTWDPHHHISTAIALSRLAHPTSIGFEDSARLFVTRDLKGIDEAVVGPIKDFGSLAFCTPEASGYRNWLTKADALLTARLMKAYYDSEGSRPPRVNRALWQHESAARTYFLNLRWVMVATGLEALINVDEQGTRQQFRTRTVGLADYLGLQWTDADASDAYRLRSKLAHGQYVADTGVEEHALYTRMETVLRVAVREALLNPEVSAIFANDDLIRRQWPLAKVK
jgi:hypothetical protein